MTKDGTEQKERQKAVSDFFESYGRRVFLFKELLQILEEHREEWGLPSSVRGRSLLSHMEKHHRFRSIEIKPERQGGQKDVQLVQKRFIRYAWGDVSEYAVGQTLQTDAYLTHASAMFLHGLTEQIPKVIYVNKEQSPKPAPHGPLTQAGIDHAFRNAPRLSNYLFKYDDFRITLLSGKNTGRLEVSELTGPKGELLDVTKIERTLIDIVVRPNYAGGVFEVLAAYRAAKDRMSFNTLLATLRRLSYVYPYHQAIGFYMERAGYDQAKLDRLKELGLNFDFYLVNRVANPKYSPTWRIHYPEGM
jgi:hypothetical protein